jgi:hypothetical protein
MIYESWFEGSFQNIECLLRTSPQLSFGSIGVTLKDQMPGAFLDKHCNRKLIGNAFDRAAYATVPAMPTFVRIYDFRIIVLHLKDIAGTILHAVSTSTAFIHIDYRRHNFTPFLILVILFLGFNSSCLFVFYQNESFLLGAP